MYSQSSQGGSHLRLVPRPPEPPRDERSGRPADASAEPPRPTALAAFRERPTFTVTHRDEGSLWVVELAGEADLTSRAELAKELARAVSTDRAVVVVDIAGLAFCDSLCATEVIEANCNAPQTQMVLVGGHGMVSRVFDLLDPAETLARHA